MAYNVKDFTIDEKLRLLTGKDFWHTEDFGGRIYCVRVSDGPVGLRTPTPSGDKPAVSYPSTQILAQTWEPELAYETGACLADDCIDNGVDVLLAPGMNIKRDPLCGRNFEYVSEDPMLSGVFGREYVRGLQDKHVGATIKHYCANNRELTRLTMSSEIDERALREIYLEPFRIACEAKPWATMCAYNLVNGVRMSEHKKLYTVLREEFGFGESLIMSDWLAVKDRTASAKAGLDLEMPYTERGYKRLKESFEAGEITEEEIDACVRRVLAFIELCERESKERRIDRAVDERIACSQKVAERGIVLLKNDGVLPLAKNASVSLTGRGAERYFAGGGSSRVVPCVTPTRLVDALKAALSEGKVIDTSYPMYWPNWSDDAPAAVRSAYGLDAAIVCVDTLDTEEFDRNNMNLEHYYEQLILDTAQKNKNTIVIVYAGSSIDMSAWIDKVAAVLYVGYPGQRGAEAITAILTGRVNPSGKLTETFPLTVADAPARRCYQDMCFSAYTEGVFVGYRYYDTAKKHGVEEGARVLFPFGHGLSYSTFTYSDLSLEAKGDEVAVSFTIKNVSAVDGAEIAQVYVREVNPTVLRPDKELGGFTKVDLAAGEEKRVSVTLPRRAFAFWSTGADEWRANTGAFEILVGASAEDIRLCGVINK